LLVISIQNVGDCRRKLGKGVQSCKIKEQFETDGLLPEQENLLWEFLLG